MQRGGEGVVGEASVCGARVACRVMSTGPDGLRRVMVLARLVHGAACFGAPVDELVRVATGRPDVLSAAVAIAIMSDDDTDIPRDLIVDRLRTAHDSVATLP